MVTFASTGVVLVLSVLALPFSFDQAPPGERYEIPENLHVGDDMKEVVATLLARSQTLRAQCARIAATPRARIVVEVTGNRFGSQARARATARRYDSGLLTVVIELPAMAIADFAELLAHELEHVIELIDNVDLAELMKQRVGRRDEDQRRPLRDHAGAGGRQGGCRRSADRDGPGGGSHRPGRREGGPACVARAPIPNP